MQTDGSVTDLGKIKIHKNVIAGISAIASLDIDGVKRIGASAIQTGLMEFMGKKNLNSIKVDIDRNGDVKLDVPLVIKYGYNIPDVADKVQENIRTSLEKMTNLIVHDINISVQGIEKE